jgi:glyoxylase-like metal-dependent hydrolase (beta-lactamase superfamily II)
MRTSKNLIVSAVLVIIIWFSGGFADPVETIHRVENFGVNIFILETKSALYLIDAGYPHFQGKIIKKIKSLNKPGRLILLTHAHYDHFGNVLPLKNFSGAKVAIHQADSQALCNGFTDLTNVKGFGHVGRGVLPLAQKILKPQVCAPDLILHDNDILDTYGVKIRVVHTPGHTPGSSTFILQDSIAFVGDLFVTYPAFSKQHFYANSWEQIDSSSVKLLRYPFVLAYAGHRGITADRQLIEKLVNFRPPHSDAQ